MADVVAVVAAIDPADNLSILLRCGAKIVWADAAGFPAVPFSGECIMTASPFFAGFRRPRGRAAFLARSDFSRFVFAAQRASCCF